MPQRSTEKKTLLASTQLTSTPVSGTGISVSAWLEGVILITVTAKGGTSPAVDLDVETSEDGTNWFKLQDVTQISDPTIGTTVPPAVQVSNFGKRIRLNNPDGMSGSSTPTMTLSADIVVKN